VSLSGLNIIVVKVSTELDRRQYGRFPQSVEITIRPLPQLGLAKSKSAVIAGRLQNMSQGGICVLTSRPIDKSGVFRCEIVLSDAPIKIATLVHVCWTKKQMIQKESYLSGLEFLL
jgi:hypothetical protein